MKKLIVISFFCMFALSLFPQEKRHEVTVLNVSVSVRVLDGNQFVNDLSKDDFELYEDGKLQNIEALYLINKKNIVRQETLRGYYPSLARHYYLLFQITDYNPKLNDAIEHFIHNVIQPGDTLTIWTPQKRYNLTSDSLQTIPKEQISKEMQKIIRKDTQISASYYRELMRDLKRLVRAMSSTQASGRTGSISEMEADYTTHGTPGYLLTSYRETLQKIEELGTFNEANLIKFAGVLKRKEGENIVFYFCQREYRPEISSSTLAKMQSQFQDDPNIMGLLQELFQFYHKTAAFNEENIKNVFADSSILFNLIFMNKTPEFVSGMYMREQSEDVFEAFSKAAEATGGSVDTSQDPAIGFKNALDISDSYYLIYYSPRDYKSDGKFRQISVKIKNKNYRILHRAGYFAN
ncbi:MAG: VWA domain-containing protein [Candidatus Aminicenantes bacterium]|nr:VWA domain-containing protein [Candidatus Aminicenantes bacterium]